MKSKTGQGSEVCGWKMREGRQEKESLKEDKGEN